MADQKEPKKETVRITLPPRPAGQPPAPGTSGRETVRINLPPRPPGSETAPLPPGSPVAPPARPPLPPAPSRPVAPPPPAFRQPPAPPSSASSSAPAAPPPPARVAPPVSATSVASAAGPKKETARISLMPDPAAAPVHAVEMAKTQPLVTAPAAVTYAAPINVGGTPVVESARADLPTSFCWALLLVSAAILTIQIWNYLH